MHKLQLIAIFIIIELAPFSANAAKQDFFNQQYRGWLWFEEKEQDDTQNMEKSSSLPTLEEMQQAKLENEKFKEELENLRHLIVRYPDNLNYIRLYKEKEKQMLNGAMTLASNFAMVNFLNPDIADQLKTPQNMYGRDVKRTEREMQNRLILKSLVPKVELFVFRQNNCAHCKLLEKHLNSFANKYGFQVDAVSADHTSSSYFKTHNHPEIIKQLKLTVMPTVIAVTKDSRMRFELARGAVSIPDLEDKALLLAKTLENYDKEKKVRK
jgi:conjugal transfer pilus assembly protein TraF